MALRSLKTLKELSTFVPKLLELHEQLDGQWEPDSDKFEFLTSLIDAFDEKAWFFADFTETGEILYFAAITRQSSEKALFWLFYMNKDHREQTKNVLTEIKVTLRLQGIKTLYSQSTRTGSAYERWLSKFGATKVAIVYKFNLS